MQKKLSFKLLSLYLMFAVTIITLPSQGWAMFVPTVESKSMRQADMITIQKTLESTVIKQRLMDYGLSPEEAMVRINKLSDKQIHEFAVQLDSAQAGADGLGVLIVVLLVLIIIVVVLEVTGHGVILKK